MVRVKEHWFGRKSKGSCLCEETWEVGNLRMSSNVTLEYYNLTPTHHPLSTALFQDRVGNLCQIFKFEFGSEEFHKKIYSTKLSHTSKWETFYEKPFMTFYSFPALRRPVVYKVNTLPFKTPVVKDTSRSWAPKWEYVLVSKGNSIVGVHCLLESESGFSLVSEINSICF